MKKALIVYSTWAGSTREVSDFIADILFKNSFQAKIISAKVKMDISDNDLVIIGTSIHAGQTVSSFKSFIKNNLSVLQNMNIALFVTCANMMNDTEETRKETMGWIKKAIKPFKTFTPLSIGLFGGAVITKGSDFDKLNIFARRIIMAMKKNIVSEYGQSDFRDWKKIENWTLDLIKKI